MAKIPASTPATPPPPDKGPVTYRPYFTHWRTGKRYYAVDYGLKSWPFGKGRSK